jgi:amino acid transporter
MRDAARGLGGGRFGTFGGVFTPNVLTILGVIMFLRCGQITGQAGIGHAIIILLLAKTITTLTAASLAAIATNTRVKGGGAYYLISRSLGPEFVAASPSSFTWHKLFPWPCMLSVSPKRSWWHFRSWLSISAMSRPWPTSLFSLSS